MKSIKFRSRLADLIISGTKTATWRLMDDKDLQIGDAISFVNWETGEEFGTGEITHLKIKTLDTLE